MATELQKSRIFRVDFTLDYSEKTVSEWNGRDSDELYDRDSSVVKEYFWDVKISEYSKKEIAEAISTRAEKLNALVEIHPELSYDFEAIKCSLGNISLYQIDSFEIDKSEMNIGNSNKYSANVVVRCGMRGQYVVGYVNDNVNHAMNTGYSDPSDEATTAAMQLVEDYLADCSLLDERYIINI